MLDRRRGLRKIITAVGHAVWDLLSRADLVAPKKSAPSRQRGKANAMQAPVRSVRFVGNVM